MEEPQRGKQHEHSQDPLENRGAGLGVRQGRSQPRWGKKSHYEALCEGGRERAGTHAVARGLGPWGKERMESFPVQKAVSAHTGAPPTVLHQCKDSTNPEQRKCFKVHYRIQNQDKLYPKVRNSRDPKSGERVICRKQQDQKLNSHGRRRTTQIS